jgi:shikimate kinase
MNIYFIGFMGCGKSTWAKLLKREVNMPSFDMDDIIEDISCTSIYDLFYEKGEAEFRNIEHQVVQDLAKLNKGYLIACGGGTPCFNNNMDIMNKDGATIYLKASEQFLYNRLLKERLHRPLIAMYDNLELKNFIAETLKEREQYYNKATAIIDIETITLPKFVQTISKCKNKLFY